MIYIQNFFLLSTLHRLHRHLDQLCFVFRIAVFAVHCREVLQKDGQQKLQNDCRLPRATCTYEQTCTLLPLVDGDLSDLFVKCNIESISEPSANGSLLLGQFEASLFWVRMICRGFKFSNPFSKSCRWQCDMLPLCLWIRLCSVNPAGFYCRVGRCCRCLRVSSGRSSSFEC